MVQYVFSWNVLCFQNQSFEIILSCPAGLSEYVTLLIRFWNRENGPQGINLVGHFFSFRKYNQFT